MSWKQLSEVKSLDQMKAAEYLNRLGKWQKGNSYKNTETYLEDKQKFKQKLYKEIFKED